MRDVRTLRTLALLDLESHPPPAPIEAVTVAIDPTPGRVLQHTLFTRAHPTPEQLSTLLARLGALMGQDRIGTAATVDSYRPGAFAMQSFATDHQSARSSPEHRAPSTDLHSVLRRCRQPVPARVMAENDRPVRVTTDRRGYAGGSVIHAAGPWRTSGAWWAEPGQVGQAGQAGQAGRERLRPCRAEEPLLIRGEASASERAGGGAPAPVEKSRAGRAGGAGGEDTELCGLRDLPLRPYPPRLPSWDRDEWDVSLSDGGAYRIFRDRETDAWFIDGIFD
jgi:hypothetical protein